jgi:Tfp pilus assembly protein PilN
VEPPSVWGKLYDWVVNTARVILIIAEVGVILALGVRVVVDIQAKQLDEQITNLQAIMKVREPEETKYRILQNRTKGYVTAWTNTPLFTNVLKEINSKIPFSSTNIQVSVSQQRITISGNAEIGELDKMERDLKESAFFTKSTLSKLETTTITTAQPGGYSKFTFDTTVVKPEMRVMPTITAAPTVTPTPAQ